MAKGHSLLEGTEAICSHKPAQLVVAKDHNIWKSLQQDNLVTLRYPMDYVTQIMNHTHWWVPCFRSEVLIQVCFNPQMINLNHLRSSGYCVVNIAPLSTSASILVLLSQVTQTTLFIIQFLNIMSSQPNTYSVNACRHSHARPVLLKHKLSRFVFGVMN